LRRRLIDDEAVLLLIPVIAILSAATDELYA
jgi:hypothetical protein